MGSMYAFAVNLLSSLMGVKLIDLGEDLFLFVVLNPTGILFIVM